jgi:hypothetical protein
VAKAVASPKRIELLDVLAQGERTAFVGREPDAHTSCLLWTAPRRPTPSTATAAKPPTTQSYGAALS